MERIKKFLKTNYAIYLALFLVVCLMLNSYIWSGTNYISGDDSLFHVANISAMLDAIDLSQGRLFPSVILPTIANNLGYGVGIFYPRLPHLVAAFFSLLVGGNAIIGYKITHIVVLFLSGLVCYHFLMRVLKQRKSAFLGSLFYITAGYTVTDFLIRDAFSEIFLFLFFPIVLWGLYELYHGDTKKFYWYFVLGYFGMLNSHLVTSIYLTVACLIYVLVEYKKTFSWSYFKKLLLASMMIIILYLPEGLLLLENKMGANYAVFAENLMSSAGLVTSCAFHPLAYFIYSFEGTEIQFVIHPLIWILLFLTIIRYRKEVFARKDSRFFGAMILIGFFFAFMTTRLMPWKYMPDFLLMIQFPWRLEIIVVLAFSILAAYSVSKIHSQKLLILIATLLIVPGILFSLELVGRNVFTTLRDDEVSEYGMGWSKEYLPVTLYDQKDTYLYSEQEIRLSNDSAFVQNEENDVPDYDFDLVTGGPVTVEIPRIYYVGYTISLDNEEVPYHESENGLIEFELSHAGHVEVRYTGTLAYRISHDIRMIFILSFLFMGGLWLYKKNSSND